MSQVKAGSAYVELTARNAQFLKGMEAAKKRLNSFASSTKLIGTKLMGLGVAAATPVALSVAAYSRFDDAIRAVGAVTGATGASFESLRNKAKYLGATTSYTAVEVANLMTELGRAGFNPQQIEEMTAAVMNLARATGTDATLSSGIMAATIRQFSMAATDAVRVADGLTAAANKSFNTVEQLGEALSYAGPVAADANMSLEETLAILGTLGNVGIQGSEAGTAMRRLLTLSASESKKFGDVFGVATKDAQGNARNLVDILGEVAAATANMGTGDRAEKFNEAFGLLGITSASAIGKNVADTRTLLAEIQNAGGVAAKTAKQMDSGIGGAFRILMSSVEGVAIAVGEALDTSIASMASAVSRALSNLTEWIGKNQEVVKSVALVVVGVVAAGAAFIGIGTAAGIAAFAIGGIAAMFSFVGSTIGALVGLIGSLFTPLGAVVAAVAALGAYFLYSSGIAGQAIDYLKSLFETLKADTLKAFGAIANALKAGDITAAANVLWSYLKLQWAKGTGWLSDQWSVMTGQIADTWDSLTYGLSRVLINSLAAVENAWVETIDFLADGWSAFVMGISSLWQSTVGFIRKTWVRIKSLFDDSIDVTLELQTIDQEVADNKAASEKQNLDAISARMKARADRKRQIESDRQQMVDNLNEDQQRRKDRRAQNQSQSASTIAAMQSELDATTAAANDLGEEAAGSASEQGTPPEITPPEIKPLELSPAAQTKIDEFTEGPKSDITGDFSGIGQSMGSSVSDLSSFLSKQLSGLRYANLGLPSAPAVNQKQGYQASGSLSDDVQRAMIDTAKHTADLVRMAKEGGLVFG